LARTGAAALLIAALTLTFAAQAESGEGTALAITTCAAQSDPQVRLACYDQLAAKLKAPGPQASAPPPSSPAPQTPAQTFGQTQKESAKQESGSWYNPGTWFGGDQPAHASAGTPAQFGAEYLPVPKPAAAEPEPPDEITAKVTSVAFSGTGKFTVTLDNGQIWKQFEGDAARAKLGLHDGDSITISRGFLGSYNFVVAGHNATFKVTRVR